MIFAVPGCHPGLLLHGIPAAAARPDCSLVPFDANSVVTGNRSFVFGSLEEATLRRRRSREERWVYFKLEFDRKKQKPVQWVSFKEKENWKDALSACTSRKDRLKILMPLTTMFKDGKPANQEPAMEEGWKHVSFETRRELKRKCPWWSFHSAALCVSATPSRAMQMNSNDHHITTIVSILFYWWRNHCAFNTRKQQRGNIPPVQCR